MVIQGRCISSEPETERGFSSALLIPFYYTGGAGIIVKVYLMPCHVAEFRAFAHKAGTRG